MIPLGETSDPKDAVVDCLKTKKLQYIRKQLPFDWFITLLQPSVAGLGGVEYAEVS